MSNQSFIAPVSDFYPSDPQQQPQPQQQQPQPQQAHNDPVSSNKKSLTGNIQNFYHATQQPPAESSQSLVPVEKHKQSLGTPEILEVFTAPKGVDKNSNEDAYLLTDRLAAVFDGETDKNSSTSLQTPGRIAVLALRSAASQIDSLDDPELVVEQLHSAISRAAADCDGDVAASGALLDFSSGRVLRIGDISVGINGAFNITDNHIEKVAAGARAALLISLLEKGHTVEALLETDHGRKMVMPLLREQKQWRNKDHPKFGFAKLDGTKTPISLIDVFDLNPEDEVVLATDGYVNPCETLFESEQRLASLIARDPLRVEVPATKGVNPATTGGSFDDRTYVRVKLGAL